MRIFGKDTGMAPDDSQKQKRGDRWRKKWGQKSVFCVINGTLSHQKFGVGAQISNVPRQSIKVELFSEVTLWKIIQDHTQYSLNKDHQHHRWQPQKSLTLYQDYQDAQDKQQTQYPQTPMSKWKMHQRYLKFQSQSAQIFGYVYQDTNCLNRGPVWKDPFLLN